MRRYDGKIAVVIGASSGLGRRMAVDLSQRGAAVVGVARRHAALAELEAELGHAGGTRVGDVRDTAGVQELLREVEGERGRIDVLVNAAGAERPTRVEDADLEVYRDLFATNFFGLVAATLAVVPGMLARRDGIVVNVSSDHGRAPAAGTPAYSASKAAVSAFTESLAHEVAGRGVHVHVLYPGWVPTALGQAAVEHGMPKPPKIVQRTDAQVSARALDAMGGSAIEINCARVATLAPVLRALAPALYRSQMRKQSIRPGAAG